MPSTKDSGALPAVKQILKLVGDALICGYFARRWSGREETKNLLRRLISIYETGRFIERDFPATVDSAGSGLSLIFILESI